MKSFTNFGHVAAVVFASALLFDAPVVHAEAERSASHRPTVGLVLSGGGARGVAYVGALKALEELHIPIDCIAGTSMGAVVGGLYASGMSPAELDKWFRDADWPYLLSDTLPRESEAFRSKQRDFDLHQGIAFSLSRKVQRRVPAGLTSGRNVMASLRQLTIPVRDVHNFDRLPIPFRAVATAIETGDLVVLREGDFVEAMRASMSVPAVFAPQKINGRLLVDGGIASNLPVETLQAMGPDVIIALDVSEQLKKEEELDSPLAVAAQALAIFLQKQTREQIARLGPGDAYILLDVEKVGSTDFPMAAASIQGGYEQIMRKRATLARFSVSAAQFQQYLAGQRVPRAEDVQIAYLKVRTPAGETDHRLSKPIEFDTKKAERFEPLQSTIADLGVLQKFDVADYEVIGEPGNYGLLVKARERKGGPAQLSAGFNYSYTSTDESDFDLLLSLRMAELNSLGGEWNTFMSLGDSTRVTSEWYQPVDWDRRFFLAAQLLFGSDFINGRDALGNRLRFRQLDYVAGLDVGMRLGQAGQFRLGYARGVTEITRRLGVPSDVARSSDRGWVHADLTVDRLDASRFPQRGYFGRMSVMAAREELGASDNYTRVQGQFFKPLTFGKNTLVPRVSAAVKLGGGTVPLYDEASLGGFLNLSGLPRGGLFDQNAALAELIYFRRLSDLSPTLGRAVYGGFSVESGKVWADARHFDETDVVYAGSIFVGADSVLGTFHLALGVTDGGDAAVYLQIGTVFR